MRSYVVKVLPGGRITIPVQIRRELGFEPGDAFAWREENGVLYMRKVYPDKMPGVEDSGVAEDVRTHRDHRTTTES